MTLSSRLTDEARRRVVAATNAAGFAALVLVFDGEIFLAALPAVPLVLVALAHDRAELVDEEVTEA